MNTPALYSLLFAASVVVASWTGCSSERVDIGTFVPDTPTAPQLGGADAGASAPEAGLTSYCPSSKCPAGYTTCPDSFFPCDVDLDTDLQNCGACGVVCPKETSRELFACVDGKCVMSCKSNVSVPYLDCDGLPDTGCEVVGNTNDDCGGCGVKCLDPAKSCLALISGVSCGCPSGLTLCKGQCLPTQADDANCGACGNKCDPAGDGGPKPPNTYFGCRESTCGKLKCAPGWMDCNSDLPLGLAGDGCEVESATDTNCAGCGDNCLAKGETCLLTPLPNVQPYCGCGAGKTFCGSCKSPGVIWVPVDGGDGGDGGDAGVTIPLPAVCQGVCRDLTNDVENCGACNLKCYGDQRACEFGACVQQCPYGRADCDGNAGCEVNTLSDPQNCGACGIACSAIAGQACVGGKCVMEPCDDDDGGLAR